MIRILLNKGQKKIQLITASLAAMAGLVLLLGSGQFYFEMKSVISENRDLIDPEFLVINKKVSILETFNLKESTFSEEEIGEIRKQEWADKVEGFISNQYALSAYTDSERFPDFYTELFFEAIPGQYLDIKDERWNWKTGQTTVPIILPQDYLNLYNFGFAPSQGLPQISNNSISLVNFTLSIRGRGKSQEFRGKIIGFSNRINSVLVPWEFLTWSNQEFGNRPGNKISRLVVVCPDPTDPEIVNFLDSHHYETLREKLKSSRLNIILKFVLSFLGLLGFFIIGLSLLVFVLSFQLMITRSHDVIRKLKWLGFHYTEISKTYIINFGLILLIISTVSAIILYLLKVLFNQYISVMGLDIQKSLHPAVLIPGILIIILMFILNSFLIIRQTKKIE